MSRSCWSPSCSASSQAARNASVLASGSARATWSRVRCPASGVRSSWEALATKWRCDSKEASSRPKRSSRVRAELGELVVGAVEVEASVQVGGGDLLRGGGDGAQRAQEPAGEPPGGRDRDGDGDESDERGADVERARPASPVLPSAAVRRLGARISLPVEQVRWRGAPRRAGRRRVPSRAAVSCTRRTGRRLTEQR